MSTTSLQEPDLPMTVDDFSALEERVLRAVELVKTERVARAEAEQTAELFRREAEEKSAELQRLREQLRTFENEREQVRRRVEKLLRQVDEIAS